jgi:hypothetical protein
MRPDGLNTSKAIAGLGWYFFAPARAASPARGG